MKKKSPATLLALFCGWIALFSALTSAMSAADQAVTGTVEGRVLNAASGQYLEKARLTITGTRLETFSDSEGNYRFVDVPAGTARVDLAGIPTEPYPLARYPHMFLDDHLIAGTHKIRRRVQNPVRHPANPVLTSAYPWESLRVHPYGGVVYDGEKKRFRMWYMPYGPNWKPSRTAYAESVDGVRWEKPLLNLHPFEGYDRTNIVLAPEGGTNGIGVFRDANERDPSRRFKAMFDTYTASGRAQNVVYSADGLHWNPAAGIQVLKGKKDSGISVFWSERLGKYMAFVRGYDPDPKPPLPPPGVFRLRTHAYTESPDFLHWTEPVSIIRTDEVDGKGGVVQVYGMSVMPYGDVFVGLLCLLHIQEMVYESHPADRNWDGAPRGTPLEVGYLDVQLAVSRDGRNWSRVGNRELFIPRGRPGEWDDEEIRPMQSWVQKDDKIHFYFLGSSNAHATGSPGAVGLATLDADRFVAVEPLFSKDIGLIETKALQGEGSRLLVNAAMADGKLQLEGLDGGGAPIPGFEAANCLLVRHDELRYEVRWRSPTGIVSVHELAARSTAFRLRFLLQGNVKLFAFQIE